MWLREHNQRRFREPSRFTALPDKEGGHPVHRARNRTPPRRSPPTLRAAAGVFNRMCEKNHESRLNTIEQRPSVLASYQRPM